MCMSSCLVESSYSRLHNNNKMCVTIIILSDVEIISYYHYSMALTKMLFK